MKLPPGSLFARDFRVIAAVAEGGMGAVYSVEQLSTGKRRALKVMQPQLIPDARARERFVLEARIGSQIESEHVVDVVASGIDEPTGMPWIAMELLEGVDLADFVRQRGTLSPQEAYEVLTQLCDGLGAAHARGIVHRDLKPENIFIATSRRRGAPFIVKILDFGISKVTQENQTSATGTSAMGSPLWMAPEQTESGTRLRAATDVWAIGLLAFWMLTGRTYWRAGNQAEVALTPVFTEVLVLPIEPASVRAAQLGVAHLVPPAFDAWFLRCLARNHEHRFVDATQAIAALSPYFTLLEASSARHMIPATLAMPSVAALTPPGPGTTASPQERSGAHYVAHPTERTPSLLPPTLLGGSVPPGVPLTTATPYTPHGSATPQGHGHAPALTVPMAAHAQHAASSQYPPAQYPPAPYPPAHSSSTPHGHGPPHSPSQHPSAVYPAPYADPTHTPAASERWGWIAALGALGLVAMLGTVGVAAYVLRSASTQPTSTRPPPPSAPAPGQAPPALAATTDPTTPPGTSTQQATTQQASTPIEGPSTPSTSGREEEVEPHAETRPRTQGASSPESPRTPPGTERSGPFPDGTTRRFVGTWSGDGWRYRLNIDLTRSGSGVDGAMRWTLAETPDAMYTARVGETATEYVRGTISATGQLSLEGRSVTDDSLITADHYELVLADDGSLSGSAREGGGRLTARRLE